MTINNLLSAEYFNSMSQALTQAGAYRPTLVVDKQRLDDNLNALLSVLQTGFDYRIVAKSLPSVPLLKYIMQRSGSNRLMSFHLPFLLHVVEHLPEADILLGKPMPVAGARQFYQWFSSQTDSSFVPDKQLHWLVDSVDRLRQYQDLAKNLSCSNNNCTMNISLELDVGLHRGGFNADSDKNRADLRQALEILQADTRLKLTGLMGYEAHVSKIPSFAGGSTKAFKIAMLSYHACVKQVIDVFGQDVTDSLIINAGGSSTYSLYDKSNPQCAFINEIATASALVKPTDFDAHTLTHHKPACFIAAPVLKLVNKPEIPMLKGLSKCLQTIGLLPKQACFIYGGNWLATPCFPADSKRSNIFGHSSNQEMYELKKGHSLKVDDYFFFRPTQSEAVFLQFGKIAVYEEGSIVDWWPIFHDKEFHSVRLNPEKIQEERS
jgi:D-serine deaminase-like pyridoxal phosphate-dependent protein